MGNEGDERSVGVLGGDAQDEGGADLCGQAQIDEPDFPPGRGSSRWRFAPIQSEKHFVSEGDEFGVVERAMLGEGGPSKDLARHLLALWLGQRVEDIKQLAFG